MRSGFGCLVGRPNTGKTTLTNALVGSKIGIISDRPQTTRHAIRGIVHRPDAQLVLVDTPGLHKPRTVLGQRLNDVVRTTLADVDIVVWCVPANEKLGPGDRFIARELSQLRSGSVIAVVTKTDLARPDQVAQQLLATSAQIDADHFVPLSAKTGAGVDTLLGLLLDGLPPGPALYPEGTLSDEPERVLVAELIREAALSDLDQELPHSVAVTVEEMTGRPNSDLVEIQAVLYVERASQKPIILGRRGERIKSIGTRARVQIEAQLGNRVFLDLHVKVLGDWQDDPKKLQRLGF
ncbi:MAG: GTPase Era [Actinomycetota bacterium]|nr:GTPase Era [Actinomycetota bacterium]